MFVSLTYLLTYLLSPVSLSGCWLYVCTSVCLSVTQVDPGPYLRGGVTGSFNLRNYDKNFFSVLRSDFLLQPPKTNDDEQR